MHSKTRAFLCKSGAILFVLGTILFVVDIIGVVHYTTIENSNPDLLDDSARTISEHDFWKEAYRKGNEPIINYLARLTNLVSDRMLLINPKHAKPTLFENWILWAYSQYIGHYEWKKTERAIRLGGGFCSQHAIVFDNILKEQGIESRLLGLNGHVLNEILVDGKWRIYDPAYNVVFADSLKKLEDSPEKVFSAYKNAKRPEEEAKHWEKVFSSAEDNWHFKSSKHYSVIGYAIEITSFYLVWAIPLLMISIGLLVGKVCCLKGAASDQQSARLHGGR